MKISEGCTWNRAIYNMHSMRVAIMARADYTCFEFRGNDGITHQTRADYFSGECRLFTVSAYNERKRVF